MKLINIGFGNMVSANRLVAIVSPESAPIKRIIRTQRRGALIDALTERPRGTDYRQRPHHPVRGTAGNGRQPMNGQYEDDEREER